MECWKEWFIRLLSVTQDAPRGGGRIKHPKNVQLWIVGITLGIWVLNVEFRYPETFPLDVLSHCPIPCLGLVPRRLPLPPGPLRLSYASFLFSWVGGEFTRWPNPRSKACRNPQTSVFCRGCEIHWLRPQPPRAIPTSQWNILVNKALNAMEIVLRHEWRTETWMAYWDMNSVLRHE